MKIQQNRRNFLKTSTAATLGIMAISPFGCSSPVKTDKKSFGTGLQLYSIRDAMATDTPEQSRDDDLGGPYDDGRCG